MKFFKDISIKSINTGLKTTTGGRLNKILKLIDDETVMITYGDGLSNVNINKLLKSYKIEKNFNSYCSPPSGKIWSDGYQ